MTAPSQLSCEQCGLVYSRAAVAREITLSMGITCRRCGGSLHESDEGPARRVEIKALRSPFGEPALRRFD